MANRKTVEWLTDPNPNLTGLMLRMADAFADFAIDLDYALPESAEKSAGMRKLLEAKDCFVRAAVDAVEDKERNNG